MRYGIIKADTSSQTFAVGLKAGDAVTLHDVAPVNSNNVGVRKVGEYGVQRSIPVKDVTEVLNVEACVGDTYADLLTARENHANLSDMLSKANDKIEEIARHYHAACAILIHKASTPK